MSHHLSIRLIVVVLVASGLIYAKSKSLSDYPTRFKVTSVVYGVFHPMEPASNGGPYCTMSLAADGTGYAVYSQSFLCSTFDPGTEVNGRLGSTWGMRWIELAWFDGKGKLKTHKYTISSTVRF